MIQAKQEPAIPAALKADRIMTQNEAGLIGILKDPKAAEFARAKACQRLAVVGTKNAVPALAAMLADPKFGHYARFALEAIPDPAVDEALRRSVPQLRGKQQVGAIHSLGQRRDSKAVELLAKYLEDPDGEVALGAAQALGRIATPEAAKELQRLIDFTKKVAGACLECCERLAAQGAKEPVRALYAALLSRSDLPPAVRLSATRGQESL